MYTALKKYFTIEEKGSARFAFWLSFIGLSIVFSVFNKTRIARGIQAQMSLTWDEWLRQLPFVIFACFAISIFIYYKTLWDLKQEKRKKK